MCSNCNGNGAKSPTMVIEEALRNSFVTRCPSTSRWADEMLREQGVVNEMLSRNPQVTDSELAEFVQTKMYNRSTLSSRHKQDRVNVLLIDEMPPSRWQLRFRYLKAKLPHLLGIRLVREVIDGRKLQCTHGAILCGKCRDWAIWNEALGAFHCDKCGANHLDRANRLVGQSCPFIKQQGGGLFCGACGCGTRRDANLAVKTEMVFADCVKGWWLPRKIRGLSLFSMGIVSILVLVAGMWLLQLWR